MNLDPPRRVPLTGLRRRVVGTGLLVVALVLAWWGWTELRDWAAGIAARSAVGDVLSRQQHAWNEGDLEAFMAGYWQSDDLTFYSGGTITRGWHATFDRYHKRYQADNAEMGRLDFSDLDIQLLGREAAMVRGRWQLTTSKDKPGGLFTLLLRKIDGKWVIVHDHTSAADPPKPQ